MVIPEHSFKVMKCILCNRMAYFLNRIAATIITAHIHDEYEENERGDVSAIHLLRIGEYSSKS